MEIEWKDIHNYILINYNEEKVNTLSQTLLNELKSKEGRYVLNRKDSKSFYTLLVYLPMKTLIGIGIIDVATIIVKEMEQHLEEKKRQWNFDLFQDFTHIFHRWKWRNEPLPDTYQQLMTQYNTLCLNWLEKYGLPTLKAFEGKPKVRNFLSRLDLSLQFKKLMHQSIDDKTKTKIESLIKHRHTGQTEHLYMLTLMIEQDSTNKAEETHNNNNNKILLKF